MTTTCVSTPMQSQYMKFFERLEPENEEDHWYKCLAENCNKRLQGKKRGNLKAHMQNQHKSFYAENIRYGGLDSQTLAVKRMEFIQHCTEIVTANCRAFNCLNDSGFKKLVAEKLDLLKATGFGDGLTAPQYTAVKVYALSLASKIEEQIKDEVRGKFVSIMVDTAKKNNRSILGLSLQYSNNGNIVIRSIGMIPLRQYQTGQSLLSVITDRLQRFGVKMCQVIAITSDNATNMISLVKLSNKNSDECEVGFDFDLHCNLPNEENVNSDESDDDFFDLEMDNARVEDELREVLDDTAHFSSLLEDLGNKFATIHLKISGIRCAAHTLQLAVKDTLNLRRFIPTMSICRLACKELRKHNNQLKLNALNIPSKLPRMDCETRWNSTHLMVSVDSNFSSIFPMFSLY